MSPHDRRDLSPEDLQRDGEAEDPGREGEDQGGWDVCWLERSEWKEYML